MPLMTPAQIDEQAASYEELLFLAIVATRRNAELEHAIQQALAIIQDSTDRSLTMTVVWGLLANILEEKNGT